MAAQRSHRPHCPGHDYHARGIYLITIVVSGREPVLGQLNMDAQAPGVILSDMGKAVAYEWEQTEAIQACKGNKVRVLGKCVMPDHFHGVLYVEEAMTDSVGLVIRGFKQACNRALRQWLGYEETYTRLAKPSAETPVCAGDISGEDTLLKVKNYTSPMSAEEREMRTAELQRLAAAKGVSDSRLASGILFAPDYDDTILCHRGQLQAMLDYVHDNPRRAILRRLYPDFYQRRLHIRIENTDTHGQPVSREYAAFGNLFLLRYPKKEQVMCHRWRMQGICRDYTTPYIATPAYQEQHDTLLQAAREGAVLVTPAISAGERAIMNDCLAEGCSVIHLQQKPIDAYWKPEHFRFEACRSGQLLILAPWHIDTLAPRERPVDDHTTVTIAANASYSRFHNLNDLAAEICRGISAARFMTL